MITNETKVTVKKGLKVGTYKVKVKMSVGANEEWTAAETTKTITVKVTKKK